MKQLYKCGVDEHIIEVRKTENIGEYLVITSKTAVLVKESDK